MRKGRGVSNEVMVSEPNKWETRVFKFDENIYFYVFNDTKVVRFISTVYGPLIFRKNCTAWRKDSKTKKKTKIEVVKEMPRAMVRYNEHKNGVDKMNQSVEYLGIIRRTKRWNQRLSIYLLEVILHNSFVLWKPIKAKEKSRKTL